MADQGRLRPHYPNPPYLYMKYDFISEGVRNRMRRRGVTTQRERNVDDGLARAFTTARRERKALESYPGNLPPDLRSAYRIQDAAIALTDDVIGGWKVGRINPPLEGSDRLSGPIFQDSIVQAVPEPSMPVFDGGFAAAEAEFLLRIGTAPDSSKRLYTNDEAAALIDAVHIGIEIASSPFAGINDNGAAVTVSDFGNNNGLVVGESIPRDVIDSTVELLINGKQVGAGTVATMLDGPFGAVRFLFQNLAERGVALRPGQWISTGAVTGVHPVRPGDHVEARFDGRLAVRCSIAAY